MLSVQGEGYQLFWPEKPEFVRMAARFGVTIIPFGCVGEDDFIEVYHYMPLYTEPTKGTSC
jgi:hypothetical protein